MTLCTTCAELDICQFNMADSVLPWTRSLADLEQQSLEGCRFCTLLWEMASSMKRGFRRQEYEHITPAKKALPDTCRWLRLHVRGTGADKDKPQLNTVHVVLANDKFASSTMDHMNVLITEEFTNYEICLAADDESRAFQSGMLGGRYLGTDRDTPEFYEMLSQWLDQCMNGGRAHTACAKLTSGDARPKPSESPLPTRCVKVTENHVCLENTGGKKGKYITLSHRWHDNTAACNTTVSNLGDRLSEVGVDMLTPTFQDAISVARGLEIPYIWIDSLCIVQSGDNGQDWTEEATRMGDYYQHSLFTICAISGAEGHGFLEMKRPGFESIVQLPFFEGGKRVGNMYAYRRPLKAERLFSRDVDQSNLMSRGWVFQEHMLSRRIVYFTDSETFAECASSTPKTIPSNQLLPGSTMNSRSLPDANFSIGRFGMALNRTLKVDLEGRKTSPYNRWYTIVAGYSSTDLTFPSKDHLVAISGVAGEYEKVVKASWQRKRQERLIARSMARRGKEYVPPVSTYAFGLWREDLHHGLLWRSRAPQAAACTCGAPSWSWLSLCSPVVWFNRHRGTEKALQIIQVPVHAPGDPKALKNRALHLNGRLVKVLVKGAEESPQNIREMRVEQLFETWRAREMTGEMTREPQNIIKGKLKSARFDEVYYAVHSKARPDDVAGWASLDEPQHYGGVDCVDIFSDEVIACHVTTRHNVRSSRLSKFEVQAPLFRGRYRGKVYDVLFLRELGENVYQRIGVGSIFDTDLMKEFVKGGKTRFKLV
ncbi:HET domain-containing protein [Fusarium keratoplasticum]|uniref:HET domain-containing protein n=1 Tax=Fusarium keratoplasticum TaxID=1328300 RepID=A0ACC0QID1_9HYPO|nr:HET domain-containing protein [Fusarium keratoplasticum]KAI8654568.1 HET domain-containing protein [Fusarium keratoplasticum]